MNTTRPKIQDWPEIMKELNYYIKDKELGPLLGKRKNWCGLLRNGTIKEPTFSVGMEILLMLEKFQVNEKYPMLVVLREMKRRK